MYFAYTKIADAMCAYNSSFATSKPILKQTSFIYLSSSYEILSAQLSTN